MKKNKISRKEFISKTSKVTGGLVLCPTIIAMLQSCSNPVSSNNSYSGLYSECPCHNARFDTDGNPVKGPGSDPPESISALQAYSSKLNDSGELIIEGSLTIDVSDLKVGEATILESNDIDASGLLIYRKSDSEFNVLSRECTHQGCPVDAFQQSS